MQTLTYRVLAALGRGEADGSLLLERLRKLGSGYEPSLPTLYRALRGAIERDWVEVEEPDEVSGRGRPPRSFRLTSEGREAARAEARRLRDLAALALDGDLGAEIGGGR